MTKKEIALLIYPIQKTLEAQSTDLENLKLKLSWTETTLREAKGLLITSRQQAHTTAKLHVLDEETKVNLEAYAAKHWDDLSAWLNNHP